MTLSDGRPWLLIFPLFWHADMSMVWGRDAARGVEIVKKKENLICCSHPEPSRHKL